jgi:uncharacterized membrane protein
MLARECMRNNKARHYRRDQTKRDLQNISVIAVATVFLITTLVVMYRLSLSSSNTFFISSEPKLATQNADCCVSPDVTRKVPGVTSFLLTSPSAVYVGLVLSLFTYCTIQPAE